MVYGGDDRKGSLPRMIAAIDRNRFPPLPKFQNKRSMVHIDDAVHALLLVSQQPRANGETYIVTDGRDYSTHEIYQAARKALGKHPGRWSVPLSCWRFAASMGDLLGRGFPVNSTVLNKLTGSAWYSSEKIRRELGFHSTHTLFDALPEMVAHYRQQRQ
jgi:nucleoside-diphosphate-sugar epimerase